MQKKQLRGQIMVIVLLMLSVLTVIALTATLTAVRDTREVAETKQYEQYYALGESVTLDMQRFLGTDYPKTIFDNCPVDGCKIEAANGQLFYNAQCTADPVVTGKYYCDYEPIDSSQVTTGESLEELSVYQNIVDTNFISNYNIAKDQDVLLNLSGLDANTTYLFWTDREVSWSVSLDYLKGDSYGTNKAVYNAEINGVFNGVSPTDISDPECVDLQIIPNTNPLWGTEVDKLGIRTSNPIMMQARYVNNANCTGITQALYFRFRALRKTNATITISLDKEGNTTPLQRTITTLTSTASTDVTKNPVVVQDGSYLLVASPLSLFDYVLRTEQGISK